MGLLVLLYTYKATIKCFYAETKKDSDTTVEEVLYHWGPQQQDAEEALPKQVNGGLEQQAARRNV